MGTGGSIAQVDLAGTGRGPRNRANGLAAGQRSQHFMLHIIPRKEGDGILEYEEKIIERNVQQKITSIVGPKVNELLGVKREIPLTEEITEAHSPEEKDEDETERKIDLKDVPPKIVTAVKKKMKGIDIVEVEIEERDGKKVYEFEGKVGDKEYEIEVEVDEKGKILNIDVEEESNEKNNEEETDENSDKERVSLDDIANLFK